MVIGTSRLPDYVVQLVPSLTTCSGKACVLDRAGVAWVTPETTDSVRAYIPSQPGEDLGRCIRAVMFGTSC